MPVRFNAPLPANPGMENLFERALLSRVLENYRAKCLAIQVAIGRKDRGAEEFAQLLFDLLKLGNLAGRGIRIEEFGIGQNLAKTLAESAFACGNSAGNSNCWHVS